MKVGSKTDFICQLSVFYQSENPSILTTLICIIIIDFCGEIFYCIFFCNYIIPKLSVFLLDLHRSLAHQGFVKILNISTGMPVVFANPYASRSQHISSQ